MLYGLLAKILEQENNLAGAAQVLSKLGEQDRKFILEPLLLYARRGMVQQATVQADALIARLNPKITDAKTPPEEMISAYLDTAKALQITNRVDASIPLLKNALKLTPDSAELKRTLSDSYRVKFRASLSSNNEGQAQIGIDLLSQAIEADPTNIAFQSELALLQQLGIAATEEKRIALIRHIALRGSSDAIRLLLAESALQRGDRQAAINDYEVVLSDKPNLTIALNNLAMLYAIDKPPRLDEARATIQKAIAISPDTSEFYDTSGDIEEIGGNPAKAIDFYLIALESSPERVRTREKLISLYDKAGKTEEATKHRELAAQIAKQLEAAKPKASGAPAPTVAPSGAPPGAPSGATPESEEADEDTPESEKAPESDEKKASL